MQTGDSIKTVHIEPTACYHGIISYWNVTQSQRVLIIVTLENNRQETTKTTFHYIVYMANSIGFYLF